MAQKKTTVKKTRRTTGQPVKRSNLMKLTAVDKATGERRTADTKQIPDDPFSTAYTQRGIRQPPFNLEQLIWLAEMHPVHASCLEQRASDVVGGGWVWKTYKEDANVDQDERARIAEEFEALAGPTNTMLELLHHCWLDHETCGMGYLEVARDALGKVAQLYHVPAHTVRAHADGIRYVQERNGKKAWFTTWNSGHYCHRETGELQRKRVGTSGGELLVIKKPTRRSSYYGIPGYISSIGWIMLALEARDYNIQFFQNMREPRWAIILSNLEGDEETQMELEQAFSGDLAQRHRNLIAAFEGEAKVEFQKMSDDQTDIGFKAMLEVCDTSILVAHRMPSDRVGMTQAGPLGGSVAEAANRVYREGVVLPHQEILNHRLNQFIRVELGAKEWALSLVEQDTKAEKLDLEGGIKAFRSGVMTVNEARSRVGLPLVSGPEGDFFVWNLPAEGGRFVKSAQHLDAEDAIDERQKRLEDAISQIDHKFGGLQSELERQSAEHQRSTPEVKKSE